MHVKSPFDALVGKNGCIIIDGGLATELERRGHDLNDSLWSAKCLLSAPEDIESVHRDYYTSGADIATTATYQVLGIRPKCIHEK